MTHAELKNSDTSATMSTELCRNRGFVTTHVSYLPRVYCLSDGVRLLVDYAKTDQLDILRKIIDEAARRGDNVGTDEYGDDDFHTEMLFRVSEIFQATDPDTGSIVAFMAIQPCMFSRSVDSCSATVYVFRSSIIDDAVYSQLISLVTEFSKLIDAGYIQCFTNVALHLHDLYLEIKRQGYLTVAILPDCVEIAGIGVTENVVMCKLLGLPERPNKPQEDVQKLVDTLYPSDKVSQIYANIELPKVPSLSIIRHFRNGVTAQFRNMRKDEDEVVYKLFERAVDTGEGYSVYECPSLYFFRMSVLTHGFTVMVEEEHTKNLIGCLLFGESSLSRRGRRKVCDPSIILSEEFRGKGLSWEINQVMMKISKSLGFEMEISDTFHNNTRALKLWEKAKRPIFGSLPRCAYQKGVGWIDLVISCINYNKMLASLVAAEESRQRSLHENKEMSKL